MDACGPVRLLLIVMVLVFPTCTWLYAHNSISIGCKTYLLWSLASLRVYGLMLEIAEVQDVKPIQPSIHFSKSQM